MYFTFCGVLTLLFVLVLLFFVVVIMYMAKIHSHVNNDNITIISARNVFVGCRFWEFTLQRQDITLCCIIFTGQYGNINFKIKVTFLSERSHFILDKYEGCLLTPFTSIGRTGTSKV